MNGWRISSFNSSTFALNAYSTFRLEADSRDYPAIAINTLSMIIMRVIEAKKTRMSA